MFDLAEVAEKREHRKPVDESGRISARGPSWTPIPVTRAETPAALAIEIDPDSHTKSDNSGGSRPLTLYALVEAVSEVTPDDREVIATVSHILRSGRVRTCAEPSNHGLIASF